MYRKSNGIWKHLDFLVLDVLSVVLAFTIAYAGFSQSANGNWMRNPMYRNALAFLVIADVVAIACGNTMKNVVKRGHYIEFGKTVKNATILFALELLYLFATQQGTDFSRLTLAITFGTYVLVSYVSREIWKQVIRKHMTAGDVPLLIVGNKDALKGAVENYSKCYSHYKLVGLVVSDKTMTGQQLYGVDVVADNDSVGEYLAHQWVDEVLITGKNEAKMVSDIIETGVVTHINLDDLFEAPVGRKMLVEKINKSTVLTATMNYCSTWDLFLKRAMDICISVVGCIFTGILFIFVAPAIYIADPGPVIFAQERVGRNGKTFKMYKFRSMHLDADERKAELMSQNKISDSRMFKMDFDPRIIGNKILPDGTHKTGIGNFIRKTSIDEFPQFFNVLKGDMSLVGTRPPLLSETSLYEPHHRQRLAIKPGITGMWQVSGRSDITDFEEVVRLDKEYINNWNIGLDIKILLKTFLAVLKKDGSM